MALGDMAGMVRKGLAASQVSQLSPQLTLVHLLARVVLKALTLAKTLRSKLG